MAVQGGGTPFPTLFLHPEWPPLAFALPLGVYRRRRALTVVSAAHTCVRWLGPSHCTKFGVRRSACRAAPRLPPGRPSGQPLPAVGRLEFEAVPWELGVYLQLQHQVMFLRKASRLRGKRGPQSRILATPLRPPPRPCPRPSSFVLWTWAGGSRGTISPPPVPSPPPSGPHPTPCPVAVLNHRPHHYLKIL